MAPRVPSGNARGRGDDQRQLHLALRLHPARRGADAGRGFRRGRHDRHHPGARPPGHRLCGGRLARCQPDRRRLLRRAAGAQDHAARGLRHDAPPGAQRGQRSGPGRPRQFQGARRLPGGQGLGFSCGSGARHRARRELGHDRGKRGAPGQGQGRDPVRRRALLRRLQGRFRLRRGMPEGGARSGRALARAVRHQRRHAAPRGRAHRRAGDPGYPGQPYRDPLP